jgi:hypothetical protein
MAINQIAVINASTVLTDINAQYMVDALNKLLPQFCSDWSIAPCTASFFKRGTTSTIPTKVFFLDNSDAQGALAYHDLSSGKPYGRVFVQTILRYGPVLFSTDSTKPTVAQCLAHEVFELLIDPICNGWWMLPDYNTLYPSEVSDPVQGNIVPVTLTYTTTTTTVPIRRIVTTVQVGMSDWILPSWSNPQGSRPFNHNNTLSAPFAIDNGGYEYVLKNGTVTTVFGKLASQYVKDKASDSERMIKRTPQN